MIDEFDAAANHCYGKHLRFTFVTSRNSWDSSSRLEAVLNHFWAWKKKL